MYYSTLQFSYSSLNKRFIAEISDLAAYAEVANMSVWSWVPSSTNQGLWLQSHKTGHFVRWMIVNCKRSDGDILYWDLVPIECDRSLFKVDGVTMRIYND